MRPRHGYDNSGGPGERELLMLCCAGAGRRMGVVSAGAISTWLIPNRLRSDWQICRNQVKSAPDRLSSEVALQLTAPKCHCFRRCDFDTVPITCGGNRVHKSPRTIWV